MNCKYHRLSSRVHWERMGYIPDIYTMFPSYRIAIAPFQFSYRIGLLFPLEHIFIGIIFVTNRFWKWFESYRITIDPLQKLNGNTSGTIIGYDFEFKWKQEIYNNKWKIFSESLVMFGKAIKFFYKTKQPKVKTPERKLQLVLDKIWVAIKK